MAGVGLTNSSGNSYVYNAGGGLVEATAAKKVGVAKMTVTSATSVATLQKATGAYTITVSSKSWTNKYVGVDPSIDGVVEKANNNNDATSRIRLGLEDDSASGKTIFSNDDGNTVQFTIYVTTSGTLSWTSASDAGTAAATGIYDSVYFSIDGAMGGVAQNDKVNVLGELSAS